MKVSFSSTPPVNLNLKTEVDTAVLSMSLDTIEVAGENLIKMMEQSVSPNLGQNIDIKL